MAPLVADIRAHVEERARLDASAFNANPEAQRLCAKRDADIDILLDRTEKLEAALRAIVSIELLPAGPEGNTQHQMQDRARAALQRIADYTHARTSKGAYEEVKAIARSALT